MSAMSAMSDMNNNKAQHTVDTAAERAHEVVNTAGRASSDVVGKAAELTSDALGSATAAGSGAVDTAQQGVSTGLRYAAKTAAEISGQATRTVKSRPARAALIAAGVVIAAFAIGLITSKRA